MISFFCKYLCPQSAVEMRNEDNAAFERTLSHAKTGYQNAQDVIKLIDAKVTVLTGLATLAAGFVLGLIKWMVELDSKSGANFRNVVNHNIWGTPLLITIITSFFYFFAVVLAGVWTVIARNRPENLETPFTVLFPAYTIRSEEKAREYFKARLQGMSQGEILMEYEDQLRIVGMIVCRKVYYNQVSAISLVLQLVFTGLTVGIVVGVWLMQ